MGSEATRREDTEGGPWCLLHGHVAPSSVRRPGLVRLDWPSRARPGVCCLVTLSHDLQPSSAPWLSLARPAGALCSCGRGQALSRTPDRQPAANAITIVLTDLPSQQPRRTCQYRHTLFTTRTPSRQVPVPIDSFGFPRVPNATTLGQPPQRCIPSNLAQRFLLFLVFFAVQPAGSARKVVGARICEMQVFATSCGSGVRICSSIDVAMCPRRLGHPSPACVDRVETGWLPEWCRLATARPQVLRFGQKYMAVARPIFARRPAGPGAGDQIGGGRGATL